MSNSRKHHLVFEVFKQNGIVLIPEYRFAPPRRYRFDFLVQNQKIAIEVEGGIWKQGRHNRAVGYLKDLEKYNLAATLGYFVLRYPPNVFYHQPSKVVQDIKKIIDFLDEKTKK